MARPVISGDAPAVRSQLQHGRDIFLVERQDPAALARAILALRDDPGLRRHLAENGYRRYRERYDLQHNGARCAAHLWALVAATAHSPGRLT